MHFLNGYYKKYGLAFCLAIFFVMCETLCDLLLPTIMVQIIDVGIAGKQMDYIVAKGALMLLITALGFLAASARNIIASHVSQKFGTQLRSDLYQIIQHLSFESIDGFDRASLLTRLTSDVTQVQLLVNGLMRIFIKAPLLCIGSLIMATRLNADLAFVFTLIIPIVSILILINMKVGFPRFHKVQQALDQLNAIMREYLAGIRVVKAFNRFDYETAKFQQANHQSQTTSVAAMRLMVLFGPSMMLTANLGIVAVLWFGGMRVNHGEMEPGQIIAFINYITQMLFSLMIISMVFTMFVRAKASANRIDEIFLQQRPISYNYHSMEANHLRGRVDFENVSFSYQGTLGKPTLQNISFTCLPGETIGIIGSTGAGKSSLVNLIPRFYDTTSGTIKVNGMDIQTLNPAVLREKIAVVPQKTMLFTGTVAENIRWGKEDATPTEIEAAARIAQAHDFIARAPEAYETRLGQGGVNFSGGQKQRLSIARALVRKPEILILDDATSAVDIATEAKIKASLKKYTHGLTCLIIAQRITSVLDADKIVVLHYGEMVGIGTHHELLNHCTIYQEICASQVYKEM